MRCQGYFLKNCSEDDVVYLSPADSGKKYCEASIKFRGSCFTNWRLLTEKQLFAGLNENKVLFSKFILVMR